MNATVADYPVDEPTEMIVWLVTKQNSFTTGALFDLSGGRATY